eukprot:scaffold196346_cov14-Tisochrysis_lutea.AAC.1
MPRVSSSTACCVKQREACNLLLTRMQTGKAMVDEFTAVAANLGPCMQVMSINVGICLKESTHKHVSIKNLTSSSSSSSS